eukprot:scaffold25767_cov127-Cylindrotheca_fusiformis.AAC.1
MTEEMLTNSGVTVPNGMAKEDTIVEAKAARDYQEELEAARQEGRKEGLKEVETAPVADAKKELTPAELAKQRQKKLFIFFVIFAVVHVIGGAIAAGFILSDDDDEEKATASPAAAP